MQGRSFIIGLVLFVIIFAGGLFYANNHAYYRKTEHESYAIAGLNVTNYRQIDGDTSPIKFRACFDIEEGTVLYGSGNGATPLVAPYWFGCFDAKKLSEDLASGEIHAVAYNENMPYGVTSYVVVYPNGEGFAWRQRNACGDAVFAGEELPENCPPHIKPKESGNG